MGKISADELKKAKAFRPLDAVVYVAVAVALIALFLAVYLHKDGGNIAGIGATVDRENIFAYDFASDKVDILAPETVKIEKNDDNMLEMRIEFAGGYNIVVIDKKTKTAFVAEADCSQRKDCVHSEKISRSGDVIICAPHKLTIKGTGNAVKDPTLG